MVLKLNTYTIFWTYSMLIVIIGVLISNFYIWISVAYNGKWSFARVLNRFYGNFQTEILLYENASKSPTPARHSMYVKNSLLRCYSVYKAQNNLLN